MGLPGESREEMVAEAGTINSLPLNTLKFHQLQILKGTQLAKEPEHRRGHFFELDEYISLVCDIVERLRPDIAIERFAGEVPPRYQAMPERSWRRNDGRFVRNEEIGGLVENELRRRGTCQGWLYKTTEG